MLAGLSERLNIVLVHGAWGGSWSWERVVPLLEANGHQVVAVDLPTIEADPNDPPGLYDDAAAVGEAIDSLDGPVVLAGHSYGGMVITAAAAGRDDVERLVYVCAFMPDAGESLFSLTGGKPAHWIRLLDDGRTIPDRDYYLATGYADCDEETRVACVDRLRVQVARPFSEPIERRRVARHPVRPTSSARRTRRSRRQCNATCSCRARRPRSSSSRATRRCTRSLRALRRS